MQTHNSTIPKLNQSKMTGPQVQQAGHTSRSGAGPVLAGAGKMAASAALSIDGRSCSASSPESRYEARIRLFELQAAARELLQTKALEGCCRWRNSNEKSITVMRDVKTGHSHFGGLQTCGSVWVCPVCASKISERRRLELKEAITRHRAGGGGVVMVTFTTRHHFGERLADVLGNSRNKAGFLGAQSAFWQGRAGAALRADFGIIGRVRALEVTHGINGWHPHSHILLFTRTPWDWATKQLFEQEGLDRWLSVLGNVGREALAGPGLKVDLANERVADYVAKFGRMPAAGADNWTDAHEMAKGAVKKGRAGGRTPMQLLSDYNGDADNDGDAAAGKLWREYAAAFKGKRQLSWTKGLRDLLGLGQEKTDQELASEQTEEATPVAFISSEAWQLILSNDIRGEVLRAAYHGQHSLMVFLRDLGIVLGVDYPGAYDDFR